MSIKNILIVTFLVCINHVMQAGQKEHLERIKNRCKQKSAERYSMGSEYRKVKQENISGCDSSRYNQSVQINAQEDTQDRNKVVSDIETILKENGIHFKRVETDDDVRELLQANFKLVLK